MIHPDEDWRIWISPHLVPEAEAELAAAGPRGAAGVLPRRSVTAELEPAGTEAEPEWLRAVGVRLRLGRVAARLSQEELGLRSGVGRVTVGSIERADHPSSVLAYRRLAAALDLPIVELLR